VCSATAAWYLMSAGSASKKKDVLMSLLSVDLSRRRSRQSGAGWLEWSDEGRLVCFDYDLAIN